MRKKVTAFFSILLIFLILMSVSVSALSDTPYQGYTYDSFNTSNPAPVGFEPEATVNSGSLRLEGFGSLSDFDFDENGNLYVLDSDKSLIYILSSELEYIKTLSLKENGNAISFEKAQGIFLHAANGAALIYIADTENGRILVSDTEGNVVRVLKRPETTLISNDTQFRPLKLAVSDEDVIFVLCQHIYSGILMINNNGEFLGFCGSNKIEASAQVLLDYAWKKLLNESLKSKTSRYVPVEYSGLDLDESGNIYACSVSGTDESERIRCINAKGNNIFPNNTTFGDLETSTVGSNTVTTTFTDITDIGSGIFAALDSTLRRVFVYDREGNFLLSFGTVGNQAGTFKTPAAVTSYNERVYVLDQGNGSITRFGANSYGRLIMQASRSYLNGMYDESIDQWNDVLAQNGGFETAYVSIGRSLMNLDEYKEAMEYFKLGQSRTDYSRALQQYRTQFIAKWFNVFFIAVILICIGVRVLFYLKKRKTAIEGADVQIGYGTKLFSSLKHPQRDMMAFVKETRGAFWVAPAVALLWFFQKIFAYQCTGFVFNENDPSKMDIRLLFLMSIGVFAVFIVSNWLISTMLGYSGKFYEISTVTALALMPYIAVNIFNAALSNILTSEESMFLSIFTAIAVVWGVMVLVLGFSKIHETGIFGTVWLILLTLFGVAIIVFLVMVFFSLWQQFADFCTDVFREIIGILR